MIAATEDTLVPCHSSLRLWLTEREASDVCVSNSTRHTVHSSQHTAQGTQHTAHSTQHSRIFVSLRLSSSHLTGPYGDVSWRASSPRKG